MDVSILKMKSAKNSKIIKVYRINRLSPIFKYAEKLKQITSSIDAVKKSDNCFPSTE